MEVTAEYFSSAEEDVSRIRFEAARLRRHVRSAQVSGLLKLWDSAKILSLAMFLNRAASSIKAHPFQLPNEREQLAESLSDLIVVQKRLGDLIAVSGEIPRKLFFGTKAYELIQASAARLLEAQKAWQLELDDCFPELFLNLDKVIESIEPGVLPGMSPETLALAKEALKASDERKHEDIDQWARRLSENAIDKND